LCLIVVVTALSAPYARADFDPAVGRFTRPAALEPDIAFWRRIYTEVTTSGGLLHDPEDLRVVYEVMSFPADLPPRERSKRIDEAKKRYARILERLASGAENLREEERRVQQLWPKGTRRSRLERAAESVRFQLGQADRFREGIVRSGAWRDYIAATFEQMDVPVELAALPHVESSFNTYAYSKVGAAGMWQFMRSTGRRFLRIDAAVDERLDPYKATQAAARFLQQNYIVLDSWPLAVTAYNHGPGGMRRAREQLGTSDITTIVRNYNSRTFGFASRNFYVAFLAAVEIDADPQKFFGPIRRNPPDASRVLTLPAYVPASRLVAALEVEQEDLRRLNPALLPSVWNGSRHVPRGFELRVPAHLDLRAALQRIDAGERYDAQVADTTHRVGPGETLSMIASRYRVSMARLAEINGLSPPYRIRAGQALALPVPAGRAAMAKAPSTPAADRPTPPTGVVGAQDRYVVRRGDTLSKIASRHGMSEDALLELNGIRNRNFIYEGQVLALAAAARQAPPMEASVAVESVAALVEVAREPSNESSEPLSEGEADAIGPALVPGSHAAGSADPADYSVHDDDAIIVQAAETLGHYAEWLNLRASQLRQVNRMKFGEPVVVGRKLRLQFTRATRDQFEARRGEYHRQLQEAFFSRFRIKDTATHLVRSGESVWILAQQRYNIPLWLLRQYNPDLDLGAIRPGVQLIIPLVEPTPQQEAEAA
jgi:membrane-bound lytic murein transglycosylase D